MATTKATISAELPIRDTMRRVDGIRDCARVIDRSV
jgi:hypothetical protein